MANTTKVNVELSQTDRQLLRDIRDALIALKPENGERADGFVRLVERKIPAYAEGGYILPNSASYVVNEKNMRLMNDLGKELGIEPDNSEDFSNAVQRIQEGMHEGEFNPRFADLLQRDSVFDDEGYGQPNVGRASD